MGPDPLRITFYVLIGVSIRSLEGIFSKGDKNAGENIDDPKIGSTPCTSINFMFIRASDDQEMDHTVEKGNEPTA